MPRRELLRALLATLFFGASIGIFQSTLNNYLAGVHHLGAEARGWLELPRELPGFLLFAIAGVLLLALQETKMAAVAMVLTAVGAIGLGFLADDPSDITPTISMGITIDHVVAMTIPILSGYLWEAYGFRWVFLLAGAIAFVGFFVCLRIRVPAPHRT